MQVLGALWRWVGRGVAGERTRARQRREAVGAGGDGEAAGATVASSTPASVSRLGSTDLGGDAAREVRVMLTYLVALCALWAPGLLAVHAGGGDVGGKRGGGRGQAVGVAAAFLPSPARPMAGEARPGRVRDRLPGAEVGARLPSSSGIGWVPLAACGVLMAGPWCCVLSSSSRKGGSLGPAAALNLICLALSLEVSSCLSIRTSSPGAHGGHAGGRGLMVAADEARGGGHGPPGPARER